MAVPMIQKTFKEIVNPNRDMEFSSARSSILAEAAAQKREAVEGHKLAVADALVKVTTCGVASSFLAEKLQDVREVLRLERAFTFKDALSYEPSTFIDPKRQSSTTLKKMASELARGAVEVADQGTFSIESRFRFINEMQKHFDGFKGSFARKELEDCRAVFSKICDKFLSVCASVDAIYPASNENAQKMRAMTNALKAYSKYEMGSETIQYQLDPHSQTRAPMGEFFQEFEKVSMALVDQIIEEAPAQPPAFSRIHETFRKRISQLDVDSSVEMGHHESMILRYFSMVESLRNPHLEASARTLYAEDAELLALEILDFNRRDRNLAVKALHKLGKSLGTELVPETVDDAYWQALEGNFAAAIAAPLEEKPVKEALAPYVRDIGRRAVGIKINVLERQLRPGTIERAVAALSAAVPEKDLVVDIFSANPKLFLDYQNCPEAFSRFVADLSSIMPTVFAAKAAGQEILPAQLATSEDIAFLQERLERVERFKTARQECLSVLSSLGFEDPEFAFTVLRRGPLVKGVYHTVSARTFDEFAKKAVEPSDRIDVPKCREALFKAGLLEHSSGDGLALPRNLSGDKGKMILWIRSNLPSADIA
jgi:hypothetical protein